MFYCSTSVHAERHTELCLIDLDGTLARQTVALEFGRWLFAHRLISLRQFCSAALCWCAYKFHLIAFDALIGRLHRICLRDRSRQWIEANATAFAEHLSSGAFDARVVEFIAERPPTALLILTSRSPDFLVAPIAKRFAFDGWQASDWPTKLIAGGDKRALSERLAEQLQIPKNAVTALGNSGDDIPVLSSAGRKIAVRPDASLARHARTLGWEIWIDAAG